VSGGAIKNAHPKHVWPCQGLGQQFQAQRLRLASGGLLATRGGDARSDLISSADFGAVYICRLSVNEVTGGHTALQKVMYSSVVAVGINRSSSAQVCKQTLRVTMKTVVGIVPLRR
jgi:hypothetical protein